MARLYDLLVMQDAGYLTPLPPHGVSPVITYAGGTITAGDSGVHPFANVAVSDTSPKTQDKAEIVLSNYGQDGILTGTGVSYEGNGFYAISGTSLSQPSKQHPFRRLHPRHVRHDDVGAANHQPNEWACSGPVPDDGHFKNNEKGHHPALAGDPRGKVRRHTCRQHNKLSNRTTADVLSPQRSQGVIADNVLAMTT
jgi:hypothetical protein